MANAKCGSVDYSQGASALKDAVDFLATMIIYTLDILYAAAAILAIVSAFQIYVKMNLHEGDVTKSIIQLIGACIFMLASSFVMPGLFGYTALNFSF